MSRLQATRVSNARGARRARAPGAKTSVAGRVRRKVMKRRKVTTRYLVPVIAFSIATRAVAAQAQPATVVWDGNGITPEFVEKLTCKDVGLGASLLGNPVTRESTTTAERFFMVQKRALECLPRAVIEARRLIQSQSATLDATAVGRALQINKFADAEIYTQLKKHIPGLNRPIVLKSQFTTVNPRARQSGDPTKSTYDIGPAQYPWIWSIGPARRRAIGPLKIAFGIDGTASFARHPAIQGGLSADAYGYLVGPDRPPRGNFRERQKQMTANVAFFAAGGPTPEQQHEIDEMLELGREREQTVLCHFQRTGTEPTPESTCNDPRFDAVRGRSLAAIQAEDNHCRVEMAESGVAQLPPHLPPYFIGEGHRDANALCKNVQRTLLALSVWHMGLSNSATPLGTINAISAGYAHGVIIADRASDYRFDLEATPGSQLMKKILLLRHFEVPGLDAAGNCPAVTSLAVINDQQQLNQIANYARKIRIRRRNPMQDEPQG
jgi:hypothetical protein